MKEYGKRVIPTMSREKKEIKSNLLECEVISHGKNGEPPRPLRFRFELQDVMHTGNVIKVRDRTLERYNGNVMYRYFCDATLGNISQRVELKYERDTMKWYIYKPGTTQEKM